MRNEEQKSILELEGQFHWHGSLDEFRKGRFSGDPRRHQCLDRFSGRWSALDERTPEGKDLKQTVVDLYGNDPFGNPPEYSEPKEKKLTP